MAEEWRVEVDLEDEQHGLTLSERLRSLDLDDEARERLGDRVVVTRDGPRMFLYAATEQQAREAERVARDLVAAEGLSADTGLTRWHPDEEAWKDPAVPLPEPTRRERPRSGGTRSRRSAPAGTSGRFEWTCHRCARRSISRGGSRTRASRYTAAGGTCWSALRPRIRRPSWPTGFAPQAPAEAQVQVEHAPGGPHPVFLYIEAHKPGIARDLGL